VPGRAVALCQPESGSLQPDVGSGCGDGIIETASSEDRRGHSPQTPRGETPQGGKQHTGKPTRNNGIVPPPLADVRGMGGFNSETRLEVASKCGAASRETSPTARAARARRPSANATGQSTAAARQPVAGARAGLLARIWAVLLANVFCGVLWCFAGVFWCFAGVLRYFASVLQYFHKTHNTPEKHRKTLENTKKLTIRPCIAGVFQKQKNSTVLHKTPFTKHLQNTAKHRKTPQNSHKTRFVVNKTRFVKLRRKTLQNARKTLENVTKRSQYSRNTYCAHSVFSPKIR